VKRRACSDEIEPLFGVMPVRGLDPGIVAGIHAFLGAFSQKDVDGRDKPGQARP
jgi:hypothetical protein